jgi:endonuclease YncB( thermonuclease family)
MVYRCGKDAAFALADRIGRQTIKCEDHGRDRYGRMIAICTVAGDDLSAWLVEEGWALAFRRYSAAYVGQEKAVETAGRGIWSGKFVASWDWRSGMR